MVIQLPLPVDSVIPDILPPIVAFGKAPGRRDAPPVATDPCSFIS
jgi:hypothetical protein